MSPVAPLRPCPAPGCDALVRSGRCPAHTRPISLGWTGDRTRVRGRRLQRLRRVLFEREPLCRPCAAAGRTTLATIRDHIIPVAEGGTEDEANIQPICEDCHDAKVQAESARGARRNR